MPGRQHVAIIHTDVATQLLSGRKRIESRLSRTRRPPFGAIDPGDVVNFKLVGGPVIGRCAVMRVRHLSDLTPRRVDRLRRTYGGAVAAPLDYWLRRRGCRFAVLIWLSPVAPVFRQPRVPRQYGNGWIIL